MKPTTIEQLPDSEHAQYLHLQQEVGRYLDEDAPNKALELLTTILGQLPTQPQLELLKGAIWGLKAEVALEVETYPEVVSYVKEAQRKGWQNSETMQMLGWALYYLDQEDEALDAFEKALSWTPDYLDALYGKAVVLHAQGQDDQVLELLKSLEQRCLEAHRVEPLLLLVETYLDGDNLVEASKCVDKMVSHIVDSPEVLAMAIRIAAYEKDWDKVAQLAHTTTAKQSILCSQIYIQTLLHQGKNDEAKLLAQALYSNKAQPLVVAQYASVLLAQKSYAQAHRVANIAIDKDPDLVDAYAISVIAQYHLNQDIDAQTLQKALLEPPMIPSELLGVYLATPQELLEPVYQTALTKMMEKVQEQTLSKSNSPATNSAPSSLPKSEKPSPNASSQDAFSGQMPPLPGGMNPAAMLTQMFDNEGNVRPMFKPILKQALKNAPALLKNLPQNMQGAAGVDPALIEQMNFQDMTDEEFDQQMRVLYKTLKSQF